MGCRPLRKRAARLLGPALGHGGIRLKLEPARQPSRGEVSPQRVHPAALRRLIRDAQSLSYRIPAIARRQRRGEAGLVQVDYVDLAGLPLFACSSRSALAWATA